MLSLKNKGIWPKIIFLGSPWWFCSCLSKEYDHSAKAKYSELLGNVLLAGDKKPDLNFDQSFSILKECTDQGEKVASLLPKNYKKIVFVLGSTGSGKSSTIDYLLGCTMKEYEINNSNVIDVKPVAEGGSRESIMKIGHTQKSETFVPEIAVDENIVYIDCPGFFDNRHPIINIANNINILNLLKDRDKVSFLVLINFHSLIAEKAKGLTQAIEILCDILGGEEMVEKHKDSIIVGISHIAEGSQDTFDDLDSMIVKLRSQINSLSESKRYSKVLNILNNRIFSFDPLDKPIEGGWSRKQFLSEINSMPTISKGSISVFKPVLTVEDEEFLKKLSSSALKTLESSFNESFFARKPESFPPIFANYSTIFRMTGLRHPCIEKTVNEAQKMILTKLNKLSYETKCLYKFHADDEIITKEFYKIYGQFFLSFSLMDPSMEGNLKKLGEDFEQHTDECKEKEEKIKKEELEREEQRQSILNQHKKIEYWESIIQRIMSLRKENADNSIFVSVLDDVYNIIKSDQSYISMWLYKMEGKACVCYVVTNDFIYKVCYCDSNEVFLDKEQMETWDPLHPEPPHNSLILADQCGVKTIEDYIALIASPIKKVLFMGKHLSSGIKNLNRAFCELKGEGKSEKAIEKAKNREKEELKKKQQREEILCQSMRTQYWESIIKKIASLREEYTNNGIDVTLLDLVFNKVKSNQECTALWLYTAEEKMYVCYIVTYDCAFSVASSDKSFINEQLRNWNPLDPKPPYSSLTLSAQCGAKTLMDYVTIFSAPKRKEFMQELEKDR